VIIAVLALLVGLLILAVGVVCLKRFDNFITVIGWCALLCAAMHA